MNSAANHILESHRFNMDTKIKADITLEHLVSKHPTEHSSFSYSSTVSETIPSDKGGCSHEKVVTHDNYDCCFHCGAYVSKAGVKTFKGKNMNYFAFFPAKTIYETLTRRSCRFGQSLNPEYSQVRQNYVEWILELADKLKISNNSSHLAVRILDTIMYKDTTLTPKLQLYAPTCLLVASKAMELDERIPFIPRLRRFANSTFSVEDYRKAELHVLDLVDWNPQFSSVLELLEFLMCQGVLFSTDEVDDNNGHQIDSGKLNPEALRENTQHENIHYHEGRTEDKKDISRELEKNLSPRSKENHETSYSDASTTGTNTDNLIPAYGVAHAQQGDDDSPFANHTVPAFVKQQSTPAYIEISHRRGTPVEKKVGEILRHIESSYGKLSTHLMKDIDFIVWEPRVVSASIIAFFRHINRIMPVWNCELEAITLLKFQQVAPCFEHICKKYTTAFNPHAPKLRDVVSTPDNQKSLLADLKLVTKTNSSFSDCVNHIPYIPPKLELSDKSTSVISSGSTSYSTRSSINTNPVSMESGIIDLKAYEKKATLGYQNKVNMSVYNLPAAISYNAVRDGREDLRFRTKYGSGTINTEMPQRSSIRNPTYPSNYPSSRYHLPDELPSYYNSIIGSRRESASFISGSYLGHTNHLNDSSYSSRNPSSSFIDSKPQPPLENLNIPPYQSRLDMLKK